MEKFIFTKAILRHILKITREKKRYSAKKGQPHEKWQKKRKKNMQTHWNNLNFYLTFVDQRKTEQQKKKWFFNELLVSHRDFHLSYR